MSDKRDSDESALSDRVWFYRTENHVTGPITTEEFLRGVKEHRVTSKTQVRLFEHGEWIVAADIEGLVFSVDADDGDSVAATGRHSASNKEMQQLFLECVNRQRPVGLTPVPVQHPVITLKFGGQFFLFFWSVVSFPFVLIGGAFDAIFAKLRRNPQQLPRSKTLSATQESSLNRYLRNLYDSLVDGTGSIVDRLTSFLSLGLRYRVINIAVLVIALGYLFTLLPAPWIPQSQVCSTLEQIVKEFRDLRSDNADDSIWIAFQKRSLGTLKKLVPQLEANADVGDPASLPLLGLTRDDVPQLLNEPSRASSALELKIDTRLAEVRYAFANSNSLRIPHNSKISQNTWKVAIIGAELIAVSVLFWIFARKRRPETTVADR